MLTLRRTCSNQMYSGMRYSIDMASLLRRIKCCINRLQPYKKLLTSSRKKWQLHVGCGKAQAEILLLLQDHPVKSEVFRWGNSLGLFSSCLWLSSLENVRMISWLCVDYSTCILNCRFEVLWQSRYHAWPRLEEGARVILKVFISPDSRIHVIKV